MVKKNKKKEEIVGTIIRDSLIADKRLPQLINMPDIKLIKYAERLNIPNINISNRNTLINEILRLINKKEVENL